MKEILLEFFLLSCFGVTSVFFFGDTVRLLCNQTVFY